MTHRLIICIAMLLTACGDGIVFGQQSSRAVTVRSAAAIPLANVLKASREVDRLIEAGYAKHNVMPNRPAADEVFLRRVYLDVVGRIPTYAEAVEFLDSKDQQKRSRLIDQLLDSEGYVSHHFNYWADLLRFQSLSYMHSPKPYHDYVKQSLRENKPYDQFVRELITGEGYTWDNGAAGYYFRDAGMLLDNTSNTVRVFLGTRIVCAQCHDHPYDSWTQKDYYQLAAFTYGIGTKNNDPPYAARIKVMQEKVYTDRGRILQEFASIVSMLNLLTNRVNDTDRKLVIPDNYQYDDVKPGSVVEPATLFGDQVKVAPGESPKHAYAKWMTSPKNARFATVIANRLWKRVMGVGVIEPVDDIKDSVEPSNPELMTYLTAQMVAGEFDMKQYLRMLLNTKTYQREVSADELADDEEYRFPGPVLRRLTAEQLWDSLLTMVIPEVDFRKGVHLPIHNWTGEEIAAMTFDEIARVAQDDAVINILGYALTDATADIRLKLRTATRQNNKAEIAQLRAEIAQIRKQLYTGEGDAALNRYYARQEMRTAKTRDPVRWKNFSQRHLVRASEVKSPAPRKHFLRQFGQSDRRLIENANLSANVPQILTLLNGPMSTELMRGRSILQQNLKQAASSAEKLDIITISILGHRATADEKRLLLPEIDNGDPEGIGNIVWAMINTQQFLFMQ